MNIDLYAGFWWTIGQYPNSFEIGCDSSTAEYQIVRKSTRTELSIVNTCYSSEGARTIKGLAIPKEPFVLEVYFEHVPIPGKYIILWTDYSNFSFVGSDRNYFWILCRRPRITSDELKFIREKTIQLDYDPKKVEMTLNGKDII